MTRKHKTSNIEFARFKKEFMRWVNIFGLKGYRIIFRWRHLEDNYAEIETDEDGKITVIYLCKNKNEDFISPEVCAKHEAIHLLLSKFHHIAKSRYIRPDDILNEEENIVRILEKLL